MRIAKSTPVVAVLAHPDDLKCVLGTVLRAQEGGSPISLILLTRGEALTSVARSSLSPLEMGELRMGELRRFLDQVGIPQSNLHLIGIPDGSQTLPALRDDFFLARGQPFLDPLLQTDKVIYQDAVQPGMPFYGESLLAALKGLLATLQPQLVLAHHPQDAHADHRAVSTFARRACRRLTGRRPSVYAVLVYHRRRPWPPAGDYFYSEEIAQSFPWLKAEQYCLTEREFTLKQQASQVFVPTLSAEYIQSNMKKDEVLWRL